MKIHEKEQEKKKNYKARRQLPDKEENRKKMTLWLTES